MLNQWNRKVLLDEPTEIKVKVLLLHKGLLFSGFNFLLEKVFERGEMGGKSNTSQSSLFN